MKLSKKFTPTKGPVVTIVLDGVGLSDKVEGNALKQAKTPFLDEIYKNYPWMKLKAHGTAVGLPSDEDMGNSEVGHNAIGAGRVFAQGARLVNEAIESGGIWQSGAWLKAINMAKAGGVLHYIGLFSDGNVHSNIEHLVKLVERAKSDGIKKVRVHILLDGRDVLPTSALDYIDGFEKFLAGIRNEEFDVAIASGGGRMKVTMDRYEADWGMVERGWRAQVLGEGRQFGSAREAVEVLRGENPGIYDQDLPEFVIAEGGQAIGKINDGDAVIFFNFRGDRAIEVSRAFTEENFNKFERGKLPNIFYAGMLEYDGDLKIPKNFLVAPPKLDKTMGEYLAANRVTQYAISETQKFGHVTYFWNGNWSGKFNQENEVYREIPSKQIAFEQQPEMMAKEITDELIAAIKSNKYKYLRVNYANGDMIGHTGNFEAAVKAVECLDRELARLIPVVLEADGVAMVTADHGNIEEMYQIDKNGVVMKDVNNLPIVKTSHTLNPVGFVLITKNLNFRLKSENTEARLSNIAATVFNLLGFDVPNDYDASLIEPLI
ncbi:MAG: 2,3-bisphosphoglycerate-independent phosphoglycerate mutase [Candidatus Altimarinota bacterium]